MIKHEHIVKGLIIALLVLFFYLFITNKRKTEKVAEKPQKDITIWLEEQVEIKHGYYE